MITFKSEGSFKKTEDYLMNLAKADYTDIFKHYGDMGVAALSSATPVDTGETAHSWYYNIERAPGHITLKWNNTHIEHGVPIAIILQYGHGTGTGGWVEGRDYINPAIRPIFDGIVNELWKQVTHG